jgi:hypothetical protein
MNKITQYKTELLAAQESLTLIVDSLPETNLVIFHDRIAQLRTEIYKEIKISVESATANLTGINLYAIFNLVPDFKLLNSGEQEKMCLELGFVLEEMGNLHRGPKSMIGFGCDGIAR